MIDNSISLGLGLCSSITRKPKTGHMSFSKFRLLNFCLCIFADQGSTEKLQLITPFAFPWSSDDQQQLESFLIVSSPETAVFSLFSVQFSPATE